MSLSRPLTSLIADERGQVLQSFMACSDADWAAEHMQLRYNVIPPREDEGAGHPARLCYNHLTEEHRILQKWIDSKGALSHLLMTQSLSQVLSGFIGDGFGWDFTATGEVQPNMLQFKGTLVSIRRTLDLVPRRQDTGKIDSGTPEIGGVARLARGAYQARAELHVWKGRTTKNVTYTGADMAKRWIAFRTYNFLLQCDADAEYAWNTSKCRESFGPLET